MSIALAIAIYLLVAGAVLIAALLLLRSGREELTPEESAWWAEYAARTNANAEKANDNHKGEQ